MHKKIHKKNKFPTDPFFFFEQKRVGGTVTRNIFTGGLGGLYEKIPENFSKTGSGIS